MEMLFLHIFIFFLEKYLNIWYNLKMNYAKALRLTSIERQVEDIYNEMLKKHLRDLAFEYPYACDGYAEFKIENAVQRLLVEYKHDFDMQSTTAKAKTLCQVLYYLKKFEQNGRILPNILFVADKNECFVLHSNPLLKYLDFEGVDWTVAPSMAQYNANLVLAISEDKDINPFVFDVNESLKFSEIADKIKSIAVGTIRRVRITEHNVDKVFELFEKKIILEKKYSPNDMVALFFNVVTGYEDVYLHPTKNSILVYNGKNLRVDAGKFKAFCSHFSTSCSPKEKARLAAISDRLIEDTKRHRQGAFFTPTNFVDFSHQLISHQLGENWQDEWIVVDPACGTKNLTRDYKFKELYCSTLEQSELDISKNYNSESSAYQFDFLNDDLKRISEGGKVPDKLVDAFEQKKKILFLMNPPYSAMGGLHRDGKVNKGIEQTKIYNEMCNLRIKGAASSNLYTQFLFRLTQIKTKYSLSECVIAVFCPPSFVTGQKYKDFRKFFYSNFEYKYGMQFDSAHFTDVSFGAILFSIWRNGKTIDEDLSTDIVDADNSGDLRVIDKKTLANSIGRNPLNRWFREKDQDQIEAPNLKTGISIVQENVKSCKNAIGYMFATGNNVFQAPQRTVLYTSASGYGHGTNIFDSNFEKCMTSFAARLVCDKDAYNQFDEFIAPNTYDTHWQEFVNDSIVYALFNGKSHQSSLRKVSYHNKLWDIPNHFFWCDPKIIATSANACNNDETYNDASTMPESFVCRKLKSLKLSLEAQEVLDKANELLEKSMKYRKVFNDEHPEYQILNADQGWYCIKAMLKEYMPNELKSFREIYKKLADKMKPMVYELGFLMK